jgi:hypothetical protein
MKIKSLIFIIFLAKITHSQSQDILNFNNLDSFKAPSKNWEIVGNIAGIYDQKTLAATQGTGILHCKAAQAGQLSEDLFTNFAHGDINISFDFMMPKGSNSGIYLQGQYEVQLYDSWGVKTPKAHDCGAIYERWDETRGKGHEGFEGHPPRQNVSFAPGLWQHIDISFLAPKFDSNGKKIANAKFAKVTQNGFVIHENVELLGPTRGGMSVSETGTGPLRLQGDHGQVAFKNFKLELLDKKALNFENISYKYFEGKYENIPTVLPTKISSQGNLDKINYRVAEKNNDFLLKFNGKLNVTDTDSYNFILNTTGIAILKIDDQIVIDTKGHKWRNEENNISINLQKGGHNLELLYSKSFSWGGRALGLFVNRKGMPTQALHEYVSLPDPEPVGLIEVKAETKPVLQRSFILFNGQKRTHAINVGLPNGINYSYDLNRAALLQIWRGKFLNATEMWFERGEPQTSIPLSAAIQLDGKNSVIEKEPISGNIPDSLSVETDWIYRGYSLDEKRNPVFKYNYKNETVTDKITAAEDGTGLQRELSFSNYMNKDVFVRAGEASKIIKISAGLYQLDNHYLKIPPHLAPIINEGNKKMQLLIPVVSRNIFYSIIW